MAPSGTCPGPILVWSKDGSLPSSSHPRKVASSFRSLDPWRWSADLWPALARCYASTLGYPIALAVPNALVRLRLRAGAAAQVQGVIWPCSTSGPRTTVRCTSPKNRLRRSSASSASFLLPPLLPLPISLDASSLVPAADCPAGPAAVPFPCTLPSPTPAAPAPMAPLGAVALPPSPLVSVAGTAAWSSEEDDEAPLDALYAATGPEAAEPVGPP